MKYTFDMIAGETTFNIGDPVVFKTAKPEANKPKQEFIVVGHVFEVSESDEAHKYRVRGVIQYFGDTKTSELLASDVELEKAPACDPQPQ